jgi:hypothetical protein
VIDAEAPLGQEFLYVAIREREAQIPTDRQENHLRFTLNSPATEGARTISASLSDHSRKVATLPVFEPEDRLTPETLDGAHWALLLLRRATERP